MAKVVDPRALASDQGFNIPGLKPPVHEFGPSDNGDPSDVDAFNKIIRELRNQSMAVAPSQFKRQTHGLPRPPSNIDFPW
jgi:hypothetical protein